jgi:hypothetical protein
MPSTKMPAVRGDGRQRGAALIAARACVGSSRQRPASVRTCCDVVTTLARTRAQPRAAALDGGGASYGHSLGCGACPKGRSIVSSANAAGAVDADCATSGAVRCCGPTGAVPGPPSAA